jgi:hypothetical protein
MPGGLARYREIPWPGSTSVPHACGFATCFDPARRKSHPDKSSIPEGNHMSYDRAAESAPVLPLFSLEPQRFAGGRKLPVPRGNHMGS